MPVTTRGRKRTTKAAATSAHAEVKPPPAAAAPRTLPAGTYRAVGHRKTAVAVVRLQVNGPAVFTVNRQPLATYFQTSRLQAIATTPLTVVGKQHEFGLTARVSGGGVHGQAEAVRHGLSRCLLQYDASLRPTFKPLRLLTRDPRRKERKKPGLKRARRAPQWSKR